MGGALSSPPCYAWNLQSAEYDVEAYRRLSPQASAAIELWRSGLIGRHGTGLTLWHYVVDIGPQSDDAADCVIRENFAKKFG